ncbi:MAG TPA: hypothetical protein GYA10_04080 [Alphaproteobacteria bacterium]|nr:hypothetical protein [Alphaproteobacteria bacterium]
MNDLVRTGILPAQTAGGPARVEDSRELGPSESLTSQAHLMGALMAGGILRVSGPLTPERVRRALDWLQDEHPILRAHIVRKGFRFIRDIPFVQPVLHFETRGTERIPLRVVTDPRPAAGARLLQAELRQPIPLGPLPRIKAALVRPSDGADTAEIVMCVDHTIADAQSAMFSMAQLLAFLGDPDGAPAPKGLFQPLPPALDSVLPPKSDSGRPYQPMIRLPVERLPRGEIGTATERRTFTTAETETIRRRLRARRVTLHGLVTAAVLKGINQRFTMPEMTVLSSVDLRRQCRPAIPPDVYGCYIDVLRTRHAIDRPLWALAQDVTYGLITTLARDHRSASALRAPTWDMLRAELIPLLRSGFRGDGLVITTVGEIGLRRQYGPFRLEAMAGMISQEVMGAGFFCMVLEREGELEFSLCYAAHRLAAADGRAVADIAAGLLRNLPN